MAVFVVFCLLLDILVHTHFHVCGSMCICSISLQIYISLYVIYMYVCYMHTYMYTCIFIRRVCCVYWTFYFIVLFFPLHVSIFVDQDMRSQHNAIPSRADEIELP
jgi:hypothetical protein